MSKCLECKAPTTATALCSLCMSREPWATPPPAVEASGDEPCAPHGSVGQCVLCACDASYENGYAAGLAAGEKRARESLERKEPEK